MSGTYTLTSYDVFNPDTQQLVNINEIYYYNISGEFQSVEAWYNNPDDIWDGYVPKDS
jgi:hypothetical protein